MLTKKEITECFTYCEYPYYRQLKINDDHATCVLYSIRSDYRKELTLPITSRDRFLEALVPELIRLRSVELTSQQEEIVERFIAEEGI